MDRAKILNVIAEKFAGQAIINGHDGKCHEWTEDTRLDDIGLDSIDVYELLLEFENEFGVTLPDHLSDQMTLGRWVTIIEHAIRSD